MKKKSSGWGESSSRASYAGYTAIAECGKVTAEGERFVTESHYTITEIDIEKIRNERRRGNSFYRNDDIASIRIEQASKTDDILYRRIDAAPFIPAKADRERQYEVGGNSNERLQLRLLRGRRASGQIRHQDL